MFVYCSSCSKLPSRFCLRWPSRLEQSTKAQIDGLSALSDQMADEHLKDEERAVAGRELLVAIADMTGNRVWRMLARRLRALLLPIHCRRRGAESARILDVSRLSST